MTRRDATAYDNIFSALAKYSSGREENYVTEAFVFIINSLLQRERPIGVQIVTWLCVKNDEFSFAPDEDISVSTQQSIRQDRKRPDITVSSPNKLIYIEVKKESAVDLEQTKHYKEGLKTSSAAIKHVILLTKYSIDPKQQEQLYREGLYKHVRWFEVYNWLVNVGTKQPISLYLAEQFKYYLEAEQMNQKKVEQEDYVKGVPALYALMDMIERAIREMGVGLPRRACPWDGLGFYFDDFWCGIYWRKPQELFFAIKVTNDYDLQQKLRWGQGKWHELWMDLDETGFFSLDSSEKQFEKIKCFIKDKYAYAQQHKLSK